MTDYRALAYEMAGPGNEKHVDAVAEANHYNESLHMHDLGVEKKQHGACAYCWLRAGRAVQALVQTGAIGMAPTTKAEADGLAPSSLPDEALVTVAEIAAVARVSKMTIYRLIHGNQLGVVRIGRGYRVRKQEALALLQGDLAEQATAEAPS
jgi:excisionase family DNA binding protein